MRGTATSRETPAALMLLEKRSTRYALVLTLFGLGIVVALTLNVSLGSVRVPFRETWTIILGGEGSRDIFGLVIREIRLPRTLAGLLSGSALAVSGLLLQVFFRNPIVGPSILGLTSGATLMVALVVLGGFTLGIAAVNPLLLTFAAFLGAMLVMLLVMLVASRVRNVLTLLVVGLMIGYVCSALTEFLIAFAARERLQGFVLWTLGSFSGFRWDELRIIAAALPAMILVSLLLSKPLNGLLLGENYAQSMGVNIRLCRYLIILVSSGLAGVVTAFAGPVAFIGLAVPHLARLCLGTTDNRVLIPGVILLGAVVTSFSDLLARMLFSPTELPISATTSLIGAPAVVILLLKRRATV
jgi:iron complex transport system permease protein